MRGRWLVARCGTSSRRLWTPRPPQRRPRARDRAIVRRPTLGRPSSPPNRKARFRVRRSREAPVTPIRPRTVPGGDTAARGGPGQGAGGGEATAGASRGGGGEDLADPARLRAAVEAVLLVVDEPISPVVLAQVLGRAVPDVDWALHELRDEYEAGGRGIDLREVAEGWRFYSRDDFAPYVERFVLDGQQARLTQAALETLAVIAYRQPVTRSRISAIRGVSVDAVMRTLLTRG